MELEYEVALKIQRMWLAVDKAKRPIDIKTAEARLQGALEVIDPALYGQITPRLRDLVTQASARTFDVYGPRPYRPGTAMMNWDSAFICTIQALFAEMK